MSKETSTTMSSDISDDIEKAKLARERKRKVAPEAAVGEKVEIEQKRLIRMFCPEAVPSAENPKPKWHAMFGDKDLYRQYVESDGYEPVLHKGQPIRIGKEGDIMVKIPTDLYERSLAIAKGRSDRMVDSKMKEETIQNQRNPVAHDEKTEITKSGND